MKIVLDPSLYVFDPVTAGTLDFSAFAAFDQTRLLAVINTDFNGGELIYNTAGSGLTGGTFIGSVMTFIYPVIGSGMTASDNLCVLYDDPTADQVISNETLTYDSGAITTTPLNAIDNSANGTFVAPYRTAYFQITGFSGGTVRFVPEGSLNGSNWYALPARVLGGATTSAMVSSAISWDPADSEILAVALDCNYVRLRVSSSSALSFNILTYLTQQQYASPWAFSGLVTDAGRVADWGSGTSSGQTLRVVPATNSTINIPDLNITGPAQTSTVNNALTGTSSSTDVSNYRSFSIHVVGTASVTGGQFIVEQSNNDVNWTNLGYYTVSSTAPSLIAGANNVSASFNQIYNGQVTARYFRVRVSSAITGTSASITVSARFSPMSTSPVAQALSGTLSTNTTLTGSVFTDISETITTITTLSPSSSQSTINFGTFSAAVRVTAFSGTGSPQLDVRIEESFDNANTFVPLYQFERITATGTYATPPLKATGTHIRYIRQTLGTTINTTLSVFRATRQMPSSYIKTIVDRTINLNSLGSVTATPFLLTDGCNKFQLLVSSGAGATVNPVVQLQGSEDLTNWYDITGVNVTATPSATVVKSSTDLQEQPKYVRAIVSTAGTSATLNYVQIKALGMA